MSCLKNMYAILKKQRSTVSNLITETIKYELINIPLPNAIMYLKTRFNSQEA